MNKVPPLKKSGEVEVPTVWEEYSRVAQKILGEGYTIGKPRWESEIFGCASKNCKAEIVGLYKDGSFVANLGIDLGLPSQERLGAVLRSYKESQEKRPNKIQEIVRRVGTRVKHALGGKVPHSSVLLQKIRGGN